MPDVWTNFNALDPATQERLAGVLETRGAAAAQQALRLTFLSEVAFAPGARVLDVGCGTGTLTRMLGRWPGVACVIGVDSGAALIDKARKLSQNLESVSFRVADGGALPFEADTFDVVTFDSVLCHMSEPERALAESLRVLKPAGWLAIFDGDYATTSVAIGDHDPLQACVDAMMASSVNDRFIVRRLPALVRRLGFELCAFRSHGYVENTEPNYMSTVIERGVDLLHAAGRIGAATALALKSEAQRRVDDGAFFGHIAYASLSARKPAR